MGYVTGILFSWKIMNQEIKSKDLTIVIRMEG